MLIVHVHVQVKADRVEAFRAATLENARQSIQEAGIVRFDLLQDVSAPTRFLLVEIYRDEQAPAKHKETRHYAVWRDAVADMMAEPRSSTKFVNLYPPDEAW